MSAIFQPFWSWQLADCVAGAQFRVARGAIYSNSSFAARAFAQFFQNLVHAEAAGFLARREFFERGQELTDDGLRRHTDVGVVEPPVVIRVGRDVRAFIR